MLNATVHITVVRDQFSPAYRCEGQIETRAATASFSCRAEGFDDWDVHGSAERWLVSDVLRFYVRSEQHLTGQPDIAIDLEPNGDRYSGWATVILPDGTGGGHMGASAEAWLQTP